MHAQAAAMREEWKAAKDRGYTPGLEEEAAFIADDEAEAAAAAAKKEGGATVAEPDSADTSLTVDSPDLVAASDPAPEETGGDVKSDDKATEDTPQVGWWIDELKNCWHSHTVFLSSL